MDWELLTGRLIRETSDSPVVGAAVSLILAPGAGAETELLLIERAVYAGDRWSGHIALPGGRRQASDPSLLETAVRETREETGVDLSGARLLGRLDDLKPRSRLAPSIIVRPFVFALAARPDVVAGVEAAGFQWVAVGALRRLAAKVSVVYDGASREVEAYVCGRYVVWGMTYRILSQLLDAVEAIS